MVQWICPDALRRFDFNVAGDEFAWTRNNVYASSFGIAQTFIHSRLHATTLNPSRLYRGPSEVGRCKQNNSHDFTQKFRLSENLFLDSRSWSRMTVNIKDCPWVSLAFKYPWRSKLSCIHMVNRVLKDLRIQSTCLNEVSEWVTHI